MSTLFMLLWYFTSMALQIVTFTWQVLAHERGVHAQQSGRILARLMVLCRGLCMLHHLLLLTPSEFKSYRLHPRNAANRE